MRKNAVSDYECTPRRNSNLFQKRQMQIIKKATKLFMKKGYAQTSMRDISKATGMEHLYYFIKSKEEILFLAFEMLHKPGIEMFKKQGIMSIDDPLEQLRTVIRELIYASYNYEEEILLLFRESKALPKRLLKIILARENLFVSQIEEILKKGMEKKVFDVEDTSFTANMIIFQLSLYSLRHWNMNMYSKEELYDLTEKHIMNTVMA